MVARRGPGRFPFDRMNWPAGSFVLLLLVATVVSLAARRFRVPYTVALVVAGLLLGATHAFPAPKLTRELMFGLVLPALVFEAAFDLQIDEVRHDGVTLAALAVPGVVAAIVITAFALSPVLEAFGVPPLSIPARAWRGRLRRAHVRDRSCRGRGAVSPARSAAAPPGDRRGREPVQRRHGDHLLHPGARRSAPAISASIVTDFFYIIGASLIVGGAIGAACAEAIRRLYEPRLELLLTTFAAYGSFVAAAAVARPASSRPSSRDCFAGVRAGRRGMSALATHRRRTFWEYVAFALNSFVFLSIGLMVKPSALLASWRPILVAFLIVTFPVVVTFASPAACRMRLRLPRRWTAILSWGGLRGALSMVLALSIPETFPQRDLLITMTFGVVILSIVIQGITVGPTLRWLGLRFRRGDQAGYVGTQLALLSAHSSLDDLDRTGGCPRGQRDECSARSPKSTTRISIAPSEPSLSWANNSAANDRVRAGRATPPGDHRARAGGGGVQVRIDRRRAARHAGWRSSENGGGMKGAAPIR